MRSSVIKVLRLRKDLTDAKKALAEIMKDADDIEKRRAALVKREAEVAQSIEEAENEDDKALVDAAIAECEQEGAALAKFDEEKGALERKISEIEAELADEERAQDTAPEPKKETPEDETNNVREDNYIMNDGMNKRYGLAEMVKRDDVKAFLSETRDAIRNKRNITGVGLTIPEVMLGVLRENIQNYSKLYRHIYIRSVDGDARQIIQGTISEAIWTDCCGNLNQLNLEFNDLEVGCWKVGGYYSICNAELEDSDINLANEIMSAIGQAIGLAVDKAILYGLGTRMPLGIVTRLAQQNKPADYPDTARPWADLHSTNIITIPGTYTGKDLFMQIVLAAGNAKSRYSRGTKVWCVNETTYTKLTAQAMAYDGAGTIVANINGTMPVLGGILEVLDFIPDNVIVGGYLDLYTLAERAGFRFATSEHVMFLADRTVMKGTARYDGAPAIPEAFVAIGIDGTTPSADMTFGDDEANAVNGIMINTSTASIAVDGTIQLMAKTYPGEGTITWSSATPAKATVNENGIVTGVAAGSAVITASCNGMTASCTVTVTSS